MQSRHQYHIGQPWGNIKSKQQIKFFNLKIKTLSKILLISNFKMQHSKR